MGWFVPHFPKECIVNVSFSVIYALLTVLV